MDLVIKTPISFPTSSNTSFTVFLLGFLVKISTLSVLFLDNDPSFNSMDGRLLLLSAFFISYSSKSTNSGSLSYTILICFSIFSFFCWEFSGYRIWSIWILWSLVSSLETELGNSIFSLMNSYSRYSDFLIFFLNKTFLFISSNSESVESHSLNYYSTSILSFSFIYLAKSSFYLSLLLYFDLRFESKSFFR